MDCPDTWELARDRTLAEGPLGLESPGVTNIDAYELGVLPAPPAIAGQPQGQPVVPGQRGSEGGRSWNCARELSAVRGVWPDTTIR